MRTQILAGKMTFLMRAYNFNKNKITRNSHPRVGERFQDICNNYQSKNIKRKISESLCIRQLKPTLNAHEKSIPVHLFN